MIITFTDDCKIGIEQIDREHEHLFELLNRGTALLEDHQNGDNYDEIRDLLNELDEYAATHFEHEEAYMKEIRDPELPSQRTQHELFKNRVRNWYYKNLDSSEDQSEVLKEMMQYMYQWLYVHIIGSDTLIGKLPPMEEWLLKENPCEFSEDYLTGIELIDHEHRELFSIVSKVNELIRFGIGEGDMPEIHEIMNRLEEYVREHFADEEEYMERISYSGLEQQKAAHAAFINKIEAINFEEIQEKPQENMEKLVEFLVEWLILHILRMDKKIGEAAGKNA